VSENIIILGATGGCLDTIDLINEINQYHGNLSLNIVGLFDDNFKNLKKKISGVPVIGSISSIKNFKECKIVNALGSEKNFHKKRNLLIDELKLNPKRFLTIIHPSVTIGHGVTIGNGCIIYQNVSVGRNCILGTNNIILPNSFIGHDTKVGGFTIINAGSMVSGSVIIGQNCYLGSGTKIKPYCKIGNKVLTGIGSVVTNNLRSSKIYIGIPAKPIGKIN
jgi:sugar O-acyltransferase (sialic acid O-acetyltransferase NeuD family)|tara:strand:+ start:10199 stop:10861 length:663 start_codon:yes stop_codon:yes gene_type:complete